jgi:predicted Zn-dependent protease
MPRFFQTLLNETGQSSDKIVEYLQTHPLTSSRISDSLFRADQYQGDFERTSDEYNYARARVRSLVEKPTEIIRDYKSSGSAFQPDKIARYTYALALIRNGDPLRAVNVLEPMSKKEHTLSIDLALAEAWIASHDNHKAVEHLSRLYQIYPTNSAVNYLLAKAYIQLDKPDKAVALLIHELSREAETPAMYRLLAKAANLSNKKVISYEALAEYYFAQGRYAEAMTQIKLALDVYELSEIERQRIETKQDVLKSWLSNK